MIGRISGKRVRETENEKMREHIMKSDVDLQSS